jgi:hypothetical protein
LQDGNLGSRIRYGQENPERTKEIKWLLILLIAIEIYYWIWWLPRNWKKTGEAKFYESLRRRMKESGYGN